MRSALPLSPSVKHAGFRRHSAATAAATDAELHSAASDPSDCRAAGPHRQQYTDKELVLAERRYAAWRDGSAQGLAVCLAVKGTTVPPCMARCAERVVTRPSAPALGMISLKPKPSLCSPSTPARHPLFPTD